MINPIDVAEGMESLSERQQVVMDYIIDGFTSAEVAQVIGLSIKTVDAHRQAILKKMRCRNTAELIKNICLYKASEKVLDYERENWNQGTLKVLYNSIIGI